MELITMFSSFKRSYNLFLPSFNYYALINSTQDSLISRCFVSNVNSPLKAMDRRRSLSNNTNSQQNQPKDDNVPPYQANKTPFRVRGVRARLILFLEKKGRDKIVKLFPQESEKMLKDRWDSSIKLLLYPIRTQFDFAIDRLKVRVENKTSGSFMPTYEQAFRAVIEKLDALDNIPHEGGTNSQKVSHIRSEFIKEFGKHLSVPYAYQKNISEILDMEYEKSVAKTLGKFKVQFIFVLLTGLLTGILVKYLLEKRREDVKKLDKLQGNAAKIFREASILVHDLYDIFYVQRNNFNENDLSKIIEFSKKAIILIGDIEELLIKNKLHSSFLFRNLAKEEENILEELKNFRDKELTIFCTLIDSVVQSNVCNYESALKNLERITQHHIEIKNWEECLKKIIECGNANDDQDVKKIKKENDDKDIDKKLLALIWFMRSDIFMKKSGGSTDVLVKNQMLVSAIYCAIRAWMFYPNPLVLGNAGLSCSLMGNYELAKKIQIKIIEKYPTFVLGYHDYADTLLCTKDFVTALEEIEKALIFGSKNTDIKGKKAQILHSKAAEPDLASEERCHLYQEVVRLFKNSENLESTETLKTKQQKDKYSTVLYYSEEYLRRNNCKNEKNPTNDIERNKDINTVKRYGVNQ